MPVLIAPSTDSGAPLPGVGYSTATWFPPDGTVLPLTAPEAGLFTLADGVSGLDAAAIAITTDDRVRGGTKVRHVQAAERIITWPLYVYADTHMEFITEWRRVAEAFTQTSRLGPGELEIRRPDGSARRVAAYYQEGFTGQGKQGYGITTDIAVLTLYCEDPYWRDVQPVEVHREHAVMGDFLVPYPSVSSSQILGEAVVVNPGSVEAWPSWTITGPAALVSAVNLRRGESFALNPDAPSIAHGNLAAGEQVTITTDPPAVRFGDGSNWTGALNWPGAVLWPLDAGTSQVDFQVDGAGPGTAIDLAFFPRYEIA